MTIPCWSQIPQGHSIISSTCIFSSQTSRFNGGWKYTISACFPSKIKGLRFLLQMNSAVKRDCVLHIFKKKNGYSIKLKTWTLQLNLCQEKKRNFGIVCALSKYDLKGLKWNKDIKSALVWINVKWEQIDYEILL